MGDNPDLNAITKKSFAAYDAHDVEGMLALCADGAQGRYLPYGKNSAMPIRGGLEKIWRGFPQAVPDFGVEIIELIEGEDNAVTVQALLGGTMPADVPSVIKKGAFGSMAEVVRHSTQYLNDPDLRAIRVYLKSLGPERGTPETRPVADNHTAAALHDGDLHQPGAAAYVDNCAACHRTHEARYTGVFPRLAGNPAVLQPSAGDVFRIVLKGSTVPATVTAPSSFMMPSFGARLDDQNVAGVVNLIRNSWGNRAPVVTAARVKTQRK